MERNPRPYEEINVKPHNKKEFNKADYNPQRIMNPLTEGRDTKISDIPVNNSHAAKWMSKKSMLESQRRSSGLVDNKEFALRKGSSTTSSNSDFRQNPKGKVIAE